MKLHQYITTLQWTGNLGEGTAAYKSYSRDHIISAVDKQHEILASSDPTFFGNKLHYNPEELLVSSLSSCHMLWYLHLCSTHNIVVTHYEDHAIGSMQETAEGGGAFKEVTLHPVIVIKNSALVEKAHALHKEANKMCFIANSCNFPVYHKASISF
jgi:organic hydroperoxide reductase OsmC/OhrA